MPQKGKTQSASKKAPKRAACKLALCGAGWMTANDTIVLWCALQTRDFDRAAYPQLLSVRPFCRALLRHVYPCPGKQLRLRWLSCRSSLESMATLPRLRWKYTPLAQPAKLRWNGTSHRYSTNARPRYRTLLLSASSSHKASAITRLS